MEHRHTRRIPIAIDVLLACDGQDVGWFQTRELGRDGFSIGGRIPDLAVNSLVNVLLQARNDDQAMQVERRAVIVHRQDGRLGLMWAETGDNFHSVIRQRPERVAIGISA